MKIAVTGATGFLGRHVLRALSKRSNVDVVTLSRRETAYRDAPADYRHFALDIAAPAENLFAALGNPDALLHLAWSGLPNYKLLHHFETHLSEQYRFLASLVRAGLPALVCTGTCFEYGMQSGELDESRMTNPSNPYGFAKDALRRELELLQANHPFEFSWARLFYMYGDGQPATSLYSQLIAAGARGDPAFKMSAGDQLRDFLPVETVAEHLVDLTLGATGAGIINICSGKPISVRSIVEQWIRERDWKLTLDLGHYPYPDYEPMAFWGSNARLRAWLATQANHA